MEGIGEIVPRVVRRLGFQRQVRLALAQAALSQQCGDFLRPHVRVAAIEGSTLVVACAHPAISHQLQMESVPILLAVNERVGPPALRRIRFLSES